MPTCPLHSNTLTRPVRSDCSSVGATVAWPHRRHDDPIKGGRRHPGDSPFYKPPTMPGKIRASYRTLFTHKDTKQPSIYGAKGARPSETTGTTGTTGSTGTQHQAAQRSSSRVAIPADQNILRPQAVKRTGNQRGSLGIR